MSSTYLPRVVSQRGKASVEAERENLEKRQAVAISKAINASEIPVKEKHVRSAILGTFQNSSGEMFWSVSSKMPLQANDVVCWKFLHVVHKLIRDGHHNVVSDFYKHRSQLKDLGKLWVHLKDGYGRLIASYCRLLLQKLNFHQKFPDVPGSLMLTDEQFFEICGNSVDAHFEFSIDMLDYMDEILNLQQTVFGSLDMSRSNSMTNSGQCRLSPLILSILDSCHLYDYLVRSLFRLHSNLPPDTLSGHRGRFMNSYNRLKEFYIKCSGLQYFKHLVQVPLLPNDPPNFLVAADLSKHVRPVVVVPELEPDMEDGNGILVDIASNDHLQTFANENPSSAVDLKLELDERDLLIERLRAENDELSFELERVKVQDQRRIQLLMSEIGTLQKILSELRLSAEKSLQQRFKHRYPISENEMLKKDLDIARAEMEATEKSSDAEKSAKVNQEKFQKMKDVYSKLRQEHVQLLRTNGDVVKQLEAEKKSTSVKEQLRQELEVLLVSASDDHRDTQTKLDRSTAAVAQFQLRAEEGERRCRQLEDVRGTAVADTQEQVQRCDDGWKLSYKELEDEVKSVRVDLLIITAANGRMGEMYDEKKRTTERLTRMIDSFYVDLVGQRVDQWKVIISEALRHPENDSFSEVKCTAEFFIQRTEPVLGILDSCSVAVGTGGWTPESVLQLVTTICRLGHQVTESLIHGFATASSAQSGPAEALTNSCHEMGGKCLAVLEALRSQMASGGGGFSGEMAELRASVEAILKLAASLLARNMEVAVEEIGDLLEKEISAATLAIEDAATRIQETLTKTKLEQTGNDLEVNERILDSCTGLMKCIQLLLEKSRDLQKEIISQGRGTSSVREFYKKNHRWTEGLLSAAKAVGFGATTLLDTADRVVSGSGKFEELAACAHDIAASTAQLVVASKVKSDHTSANLQALSRASKEVITATGAVVASAKSGAQIVEDAGLMDFSSMTLYQTKQMEMNVQIHVMELEANLEKERRRLGELRRQHYQLTKDESGLLLQVSAHLT